MLALRSSTTLRWCITESRWSGMQRAGLTSTSTWPCLSSTCTRRSSWKRTFCSRRLRRRVRAAAFHSHNAKDNTLHSTIKYHKRLNLTCNILTTKYSRMPIGRLWSLGFDPRTFHPGVKHLNHPTVKYNCTWFCTCIGNHSSCSLL